ncbi:hypothetical protein C2845_PM13G25350 [Panicum miliaceum]|uniref:Uncharacterized protein n=1 Tax=Panicum miliaceum TaxID=4540 RepID=A0A3L6RGK6_PANMI|nr:hypothetical protein C2845_PM13G25350 [Panicum miliaceum]
MGTRPRASTSALAWVMPPPPRRVDPGLGVPDPAAGHHEHPPVRRDGRSRVGEAVADTAEQVRRGCQLHVEQWTATPR